MRITHAVVQPLPPFDLHPRQQSHGLSIDRRHGERDLRCCSPLLLQQLEKSGVAEILFKVDAGGEIVSIDFGHRQACCPKMAGKADERGVFVAIAVFDANRRPAVGRHQAEEFPLGTIGPQCAGLHGRGAEAGSKKFCEPGMHGSVVRQEIWGLAWKATRFLSGARRASERSEPTFPTAFRTIRSDDAGFLGIFLRQRCLTFGVLDGIQAVDGPIIRPLSWLPQ